MPINIVINGYYRTGTTFLWDVVRRNHKNYIAFYEPLHPHLASYVQEFRRRAEPHKLHNLELWREYAELDDETLFRLFLNHPNTNNEGVTSVNQLQNYLDVYHHMSRNVVLQPNRAHFFLGLISERYDCKVVHVVRNPDSVYRSIVASYSTAEQYSQLINIIRAILKPLRIHRTFSIVQECQWIKEHLGYPVGVNVRCWNQFISLSSFDMFVINWTISNYIAIKETVRVGGLVCCYEEMYQSKQRLEKDITNYLEIDGFALDGVRSKRIEKSKFGERFLRTLHNLGLLDEYAFILENVRNRGITY